MALRAAVAALAVAAAVGATWAAQAWRSRGGLLRAAERLARGPAPRLDLAIQYVDGHLAGHPDDPAAADLRAEILSARASNAADLAAAVEAGNRAHRLDPGRQSTSRRLVSDMLRLAAARGGADPAGYRAARAIVDRLGAAGADDAEYHRLAARVAAEMAAPDDAGAAEDARRHDGWIVDRRPGDVDAASRLAALLRDRLGDPAGATRVVDAMIAADGGSPRAHLVRHDHLIRVDPEDRDGRASAEVEAALAGDPRDPRIRLAAAEDAIRRGRTAAARRHLDAIAPSGRDDARVWSALGTIAVMEGRPADAVAPWRAALVRRGGDDRDLAWRLALLLLNLGRDAEAGPLIARYRALSGDEPTAEGRYLEAVRLGRDGRASEAVAALELVRTRAPKALLPLVDRSIGLDLESIRMDSAAVAALRRASRGAPRAASPRVDLARRLAASDPGAAAAEVRVGLAIVPDDPALLTALARLLLDDQLARPPADRRRGDLDATLAAARRAAPGSAALARVEAASASAGGRDDDATRVLEAATRVDPRDPGPWADLARLLARRGDAGDALRLLERAATADAAGDSVAVRSASANVLAASGRLGAARGAILGDLGRLAAADRASAWARWGDVLDAAGDADGATTAYAEWARRRPEDPRPRLILICRAAGRADPEGSAIVSESLAALDSANVARGSFAEVGRALAGLRAAPAGEDEAARERRVSAAEAALGRARLADPGRPELAEAEGLAWEARGRVDRAVAAHERALRSGGLDAAPLLAAALAGPGREADLDRLARERPPWLDRVRRLAASEAARRGRAAEAGAIAGAVVADDPEGVDTLLWRASILDELGDPDGGDAPLAALAARAPGRPEAWFPLLDRQVAGGRPGAARATIDRLAEGAADEPSRRVVARLRVRIGDVGGLGAGVVAEIGRGDDEATRDAVDALIGAGRAGEAAAIVGQARDRRPHPRWADRVAAVLRSGPGGPDDLREAEAILGGPSADDLPEDRLARASILARSPGADGRRAAADLLAAILADVSPTGPLAAEARLALADVDVALGRHADALAAIAGDDRPIAAEVAARAGLGLGDWAAARGRVDRLEADRPGRSSAARLRARLEAARGRPDEAARLLESWWAAAADDPDRGEAASFEALRGLVELGPAGAAAARRVAERSDRLRPRSAWRVGAILGRAPGAGGRVALDASGDEPEEAAAGALAGALEASERRRDRERPGRLDAIGRATLERDPDDQDRARGGPLDPR